MKTALKEKGAAIDGERIIASSALSLEFVPHGDKNEVPSSQKKKVQDLLTQMHIRAKKRGRPKREEEKEAA